MQIALHPKQQIAFLSTATELLYGGAAGGGKSYLLRVSAIRWCLSVPGIQVYLFRRTLPDLRSNHLRGPTSLHVLLAEYVASGHVKYRTQENEFVFWQGSRIALCHCQYEDDVLKYQGAEIHVLMPDELTHFTDYQYRFLRSRVRIAGLTIPPQYHGLLPRIEAASNPVSVGHAHVKAAFVSPVPPLTIWRAPSDEGGMLRQYIPARLSDNPALDTADPSYLQRLEGMGTPELVRAMRDGDWDIIAGQAFERLRRDIHRIAPFPIPSHWLRFRAMDWGSSKPFSVGWYAVSDGVDTIYPRGALICYREWYGWNGKADEGLRLEVTDVARGIKERSGREAYAYSVGDPAMWKVDGGPSHAETMRKAGVILRPADNSRKAGYLQVRQRIADNMLYVFTSCHDGFWRTMPDLIMDSHDPEDVDCWVAGTMIATPSGEVPIQDVRAGDKVLTPIGPCRVLRSYVSGSSETVRITLSDGRVLQGTPRHKIHVNGLGLVRLDALQCDLNLTEKIICQRALFIAASYIDVMKTGFTTIRERVASVFTAKPGSMSAALYQRASTFITWMATTTTIQSLTLNAFRALSMRECISVSGYRGSSGSSLTTGENLKMGSAHCATTPEKCGSERPSVHLRAAIVETLWLRDSIIRFAVKIADSLRLPRAERSSNASYVQQNLEQNLTKLEKFRPARIVAVGRCEERTLVYNLTVDSAQLFYANGILSSNTGLEDHCYDQTRYACMSRPLTRDKPTHKAPPKPGTFEWLTQQDQGSKKSIYRL